MPGRSRSTANAEKIKHTTAVCAMRRIRREAELKIAVVEAWDLIQERDMAPMRRTGSSFRLSNCNRSHHKPMCNSDTLGFLLGTYTPTDKPCTCPRQFPPALASAHGAVFWSCPFSSWFFLFFVLFLNRIDGRNESFATARFDREKAPALTRVRTRTCFFVGLVEKSITHRIGNWGT
jgi:hypothetical protein